MPGTQRRPQPGCAGLPLKPLPPKVELAAVRVQGLAAGDLRLAVKLDVDNPNPFALDIARIDAEINVNGTQLALATLPAPVSVMPWACRSW
jgi:LEA14-like dessication related protein